MSRTFIRQDTQIGKSDLFTDNILPGQTTLETNSTNIEDDLNSLRSRVHDLLNVQTSNWYATLNTPGSFEFGAKRGVNDLNTNLHDLERKRVLVANFTDITVTVPASVQATATFSSSGVFSNNETVNIGGHVYTFKSPFVNAANNIDASGTTAQTHENLRRAINGDGIAGTNYGTGTPTNTQVTATDTATSNVLTAIAGGTVGNLILLSETCANATIPANLSGGAGDVSILTLGQVPASPGNIAAIGSVTTLGSVAAYNASFGNHSLALVTGGAPISPKNLCDVYDATTGQVILSGTRQVYALFQTESSTDGSTMTGTTPNRAQLSYVRINNADTALEPVPAADVAGKSIDYTSVLRKGLNDLTEQDFLRGTTAQVPTGTSVTRQIAYDQQGTLPVELTTNATLDIAGGLAWKIRDLLNTDLLSILEGSGGGTSTVQLGTDVDTFDVNAIVNDFNSGVAVATGGARINVGTTVIANTATVESVGATTDLRLLAARDLYLDDSWQAGSTWAQTNGIKLAAATAEWNLFETNYGEVSLLNALNQAKNASSRYAKVYSNVTVTTLANLDVSLADGNLDTALPRMDLGNFLTDYDVFLNGTLLRPGANSGANHDYYPGAALGPTAAQLRFEFKVKSTGVADVICVIPYA